MSAASARWKMEPPGTGHHDPRSGGGLPRVSRRGGVYPHPGPATGGGQNAIGCAPVEGWSAARRPGALRSRAGACGRWTCAPPTRDSQDRGSLALRPRTRHNGRSRKRCPSGREATSAAATESSRGAAGLPRIAPPASSARRRLCSDAGRTVPAPSGRPRSPTRRSARHLHSRAAQVRVILPRQGSVCGPDDLRLRLRDHLQHAVWIIGGKHHLQGREGGSPAPDPSRQNADVPCGRLLSHPPASPSPKSLPYVSHRARSRHNAT